MCVRPDPRLVQVDAGMTFMTRHCSLADVARPNPHHVQTVASTPFVVADDDARTHITQITGESEVSSASHGQPECSPLLIFSRISDTSMWHRRHRRGRGREVIDESDEQA